MDARSRFGRNEAAQLRLRLCGPGDFRKHFCNDLRKNRHTKMSISLFVIWGPTSTGKTKASVSLSKLVGAPVVSLDRIQCFPELSTGSGRPSLLELEGSERIYLASRRLSEGVVSAADANAMLKKHVSRISMDHPRLILEGGSISLLNEIMSDPYWRNGFKWSSKRLRLGDPAVFMARATRRVHDMFYPIDGAASLLDELVLAWAQVAHRKLLEDIDGYRAAILFARRSGLQVEDLPSISAALKESLIKEIACEYLRHAQWQERDFLPAPSSWTPIGSLPRQAEAHSLCW